MSRGGKYCFFLRSGVHLQHSAESHLHSHQPNAGWHLWIWNLSFTCIDRSKTSPINKVRSSSTAGIKTTTLYCVAHIKQHKFRRQTRCASSLQLQFIRLSLQRAHRLLFCFIASDFSPEYSSTLLFLFSR